jgi:large subunit ribosomal protein L11
MEFCKQFNARTQDKPAKYAQYKLLCIKTNHLILLLKLLQQLFSYWMLKKLKSGSSLIVKKVASVTWEQIRAIAEDKMPDLNAIIEKAMSMVGTARSMGITVSGDALLIKRKTWQN